MFDFGFSEFGVIIVLAVFLIGPKDMPGIMIALGRVFKRIQYIRFAISRQFDDVLHDVNLEELRREAMLRAEGTLDEDADIGEVTDTGAEEISEDDTSDDGPAPEETRH